MSDSGHGRLMCQCLPYECLHGPLSHLVPAADSGRAEGRTRCTVCSTRSVHSELLRLTADSHW